MSEVAEYEQQPALGGRLTAEQMVARFLVTRRAGNTRASYGRDLGVQVATPGSTGPGAPRPCRVPAWIPFCRSLGIDPVYEADQVAAAIWARQMEVADLAASTRKRRLSSVSSFFSWLVGEGLVEKNPLASLPRPYVDPDVSMTPGLTKEQALALLKAADEARGPQAARNAAIIALYIFTGIRQSELSGADTDDIGLDSGHRILWLTGKGGAREFVVVPPPAWERIDAYLQSRSDISTAAPAVPRAITPQVPLFVTKNGKRVRVRELWETIRSLARKAGFPPELVDRLCNHALRHTFATLALDSGATLRDLQDAMRHKDPRTSRRYDRGRNKKARSPGYTLAAYLTEEGDGG